jgi:hypothetical protein
MELKTLNDINRVDKEWLDGAVSYKELKAEAVKWVKEDIRIFEEGEHSNEWNLIERWMGRLNITEEDLECEKKKGCGKILRNDMRYKIICGKDNVLCEECEK